MPKGITQKTGSAPIVRQGHTTDGTNGSAPTANSIPSQRPVRDLKAKG